MTLKKIYKRAVTGKIIEWEIEVIDNRYRTITGQQNGKKITSEWTVCAGKNIGRANATTPKEQALKEAQALRTKKLEKEYKEYVEQVDNLSYFKPMLAYEYDPSMVFNDILFSQPKLDGIRGERQKSDIKSRNGKLFVSVPHIVKATAELVKAVPTLTLDGELYNHLYKENFNAITSIVKKLKPTAEDLELSEQYMQYWIYDVFDSRYPDMNFKERNQYRNELFSKYSLNSNILVNVPTVVCHNKEELDAQYEWCMEQGYEGQMVRQNKPYVNKRTKYLLKRKEFKTEEFVVLDVVEGIGNRSGTAGYIETVTKDGKSFRANMRGTFEYLTSVLKNKKALIGTEATIRFFRLTPDGVPRFPVVIEFDRKAFE